MNKYKLLFSIIVAFALFSCEKDQVSIAPELTVTLKALDLDSADYILERHSLTPEEYRVDSVMRSPKIKKAYVDSIILGNKVGNIEFEIKTNCTWTIQKFTGYGYSGNNLWFAKPILEFGGGDGKTSSAIKAFTSTSQTTPPRRVRVYLVTGDSSVVYKYIFVQKVPKK